MKLLPVSQANRYVGFQTMIILHMQLCLICGSAKISVSRIFSGLFFANSILDHLYLSSDTLEIAKLKTIEQTMR